MSGIARVIPPVEKPQSEYYVWRFPGSPLRIYLKLELVRQMRECLQAAVLREKDLGGVLIGEVGPGCVFIEGFREFDRLGPDREFILDPAERERFKHALQSFGAGDRNSSVVGYFRGTSGALALSKHDLLLINESFRNPSSVFLVISQESEQPPTGGFFFWSSGDVFADSSFMPFPFDETSLPSTPRPPDRAVPERPPERAVPEKRHPETPIVTSAEATPGKKPASQSTKRRLLVAAVLICLVGITAVMLYSRVRGAKPASNPVEAAAPRELFPPQLSPEPAMHLAGSKYGRDLNLSWNPQLPGLSSARIGLLTIKDGSTTRELTLTAAQLRGGRAVYTPISDQVEVMLEVFSSSGKSTSDSVLFVLTRLDEKTPAPQTSASSDRPTQFADDGYTRWRTESRSERQVRGFVPPPASVPSGRSTRVVLTEPPPAVDAALPPELVARSSAAPPAITSAISRPVLIPVQPPVETRKNQPALNPAAVTIAPRPIRQVRPALPSNVRAMVVGKSEVDVRVQIDTAGRVVAAEPVATDGSLDRYLGTAAVSAAKLWTFQPAQAGDQKIPATLVLRFTFEPGR
jgi:TonB family protein